ncbi:MAG: hypothetical protein A2W19_14555 [Spirochaetes bacterium RBG_16_49_21]|nr:MAG: hypothetical protein A2W19_14555 [Spirochaetes bacterium RBG_16_49_21]
MKNIALFLMILFAFAASRSAEPEKNRLQLDEKFFSELYRTPPVLRDSFLEHRLNSIVSGRGIIKSIDAYGRLKKNYRLVLIDEKASRSNCIITYHLYLADKDTVSILKKDELFEFTGQLIAYTPLNSKRDAYILDVILEKGIMILE